MAIVVLGNLVCLSQFVYWLKPITAYEIHLSMSSYLATILRCAKIRGPRRMFYNMD